MLLLIYNYQCIVSLAFHDASFQALPSTFTILREGLAWHNDSSDQYDFCHEMILQKYIYSQGEFSVSVGCRKDAGVLPFENLRKIQHVMGKLLYSSLIE